MAHRPLAVRSDDEALAVLHPEQRRLDPVLQCRHPAAVARAAKADGLVQARDGPRRVKIAEAHREGARARVPFEVVTTDPFGIDVLNGVGRLATEWAGAGHQPSINPPQQLMGKVSGGAWGGRTPLPVRAPA